MCRCRTKLAELRQEIATLPANAPRTSPGHEAVEATVPHRQRDVLHTVNALEVGNDPWRFVSMAASHRHTTGDGNRLHSFAIAARADEMLQPASFSCVRVSARRCSDSEAVTLQQASLHTLAACLARASAAMNTDSFCFWFATSTAEYNAPTSTIQGNTCCGRRFTSQGVGDKAPWHFTFQYLAAHRSQTWRACTESA